MNAEGEPRAAAADSRENPPGALPLRKDSARRVSLPWDRRWERFYRRALPAYWVFLFVATHFPKLRLPEAVPRGDKLAHFAAYALLAVFFWKFFEANQRPLSGRFVWNALAVIAVYAAADEVLQPLVGRSADAWDWVCDVVGAALALAALEWNRRRLAGRRGDSTRA